MFVDQAKIYIKAGDGGDGAVSFHREKYVAAGGPDGGDGGKGGDIVFVVDDNISNLIDFRYKRKYVAEKGQNGGAKNCSGRNAPDLVVKVPRGTVVREIKSGRILADLSTDEPAVIAHGGKGGRGNAHFATSTRQIPKFAKPGFRGDEYEVMLELKLIADVGLVGFPNVGKSTLISVVSAAKPKIANYHFTTLTPVLGVVKIAEQVLVNKRSREKAEKSRIDLKKKLAGSIDLSNQVQKFVDCRSKDLSQRELYIVEGDSALGYVKMARNAEFQAVIPVRGKILNCLKADYDKIFKNEIITDLIKVIGCGVEVKTGKNKEISMFNLDNLRWNKIVICTDADVDGFHIRTLILTMLYRLVPTLIEKGYVYIAESPLFEITTSDKTYFAYDENEKTKILKMIGNKKFDIQRSKGLGENEAEMMSLTTMDPATRRLIKIEPDDIEQTQWMFDMLLGDDLQGRKDFITNNGVDYLDMADIS